MDVGKVISALDSDLRREILRIVAENPSTVIDVLSGLRKRGFKVKYRETVYRAMEKLVEAGLLEKYYEKEKGLCYKVSLTSIVIDITKNTVTMLSK
jgi:Fe2+ or Zn2+ uptake regulation protein